MQEDETKRPPITYETVLAGVAIIGGLVAALWFFNAWGLSWGSDIITAPNW